MIARIWRGWTATEDADDYVAAGGPVETTWGDVNTRVRAPDGMQLTLFTTP